MVDAQSREATCGQNYPTKNIFVISDDNYLQIHNEATFEFVNMIDVPMDISQTDDPIEVLTIKVSPNEELLGVIAGKNLIKEEEELHQIFIYRLTATDGIEDNFKLLFKFDLPDEYRYFSRAFEFNCKAQESELFLTN
jgi:hypothetical protein